MARSETPVPVQRHALGGYKPVDVEDSQAMEQVQVAANFAVKRVIAGGEPSYSFSPELSSLDDENDQQLITKVLRASMQVVAGMNYRMTIAILKPDGECVGAFKCVVYDRFGDLQVTSWGEETSCSEVTAMLQEKKPEEPGPET
jgi:hypothetical protein